MPASFGGDPSRWLGVVSKWWTEFIENGVWESLRARSSRPLTNLIEEIKYVEPFIYHRKENSKLGAKKIKAVLKIGPITGFWSSGPGRCW